MSNMIGRFFDIQRFVLWSDEALESGDQNNKPRLVLSFRDGYPRITVYTGINSKEGVISFPSDYPTMTYIFNVLKEVANSEPGAKFVVDSLTNSYGEDGKPTGDKKLVSKLFVGKSKSGVVYLSVISEDKPKIVFPIKPSPYHVFRDSENNEIPEEVISSKLAIGIADLALGILANAIIQHANEQIGSRSPNKLNGKMETITNIESIDDLDI